MPKLLCHTCRGMDFVYLGGRKSPCPECNGAHGRVMGKALPPNHPLHALDRANSTIEAPANTASTEALEAPEADKAPTLPETDEPQLETAPIVSSEGSDTEEDLHAEG